MIIVEFSYHSFCKFEREIKQNPAEKNPAEIQTTLAEFKLHEIQRTYKMAIKKTAKEQVSYCLFSDIELVMLFIR